MSYDGFISYSHAADDLLAPRLQLGLQRFAKPWWKRRALRVFRDESSLSANPHLWESIADALDTSGWFVLLLSPEAAQSEWVNQEVAYWVEHKDPSRLLPVVTAGEFGWADGDVTGDVVPAALQGVFPDEPRWVDLRFAKAEEQLDLQDPRFADAIADVASAMRGIPKDELAGEEVRQHRRTVRTAWAAGLLLVALLISSGFAGIAAARNADEARASDLATASINALATDPELGLLLAVMSADAGNELGLEQRRALHAAVHQHRTIAAFDWDGPWIWSTFAPISPDGSLVAVFGQKGVVDVYAVGDTAEPLWTFDDVPPDYSAWPVFTADSRYLLIEVGWNYWDASVQDTPPDPKLLGLRAFDARTGDEVAVPPAPIECDGLEVIYHLQGAEILDSGALAGACHDWADTGYWWLGDLSSGNLVHGPTEIGTVPVFDPVYDASRATFHYTADDGLHSVDPTTGADTLAFADDYDFVIGVGEGIALRIGQGPAFFSIDDVIDLDTGLVTEVNSDPNVECMDGNLVPSQRVLLIGCDNGTVRLVSVDTGDIEDELLGPDGWALLPTADASGRFVTAGAVDGSVRIWDRHPTGEAGVITPPAGYVADSSLSVVGEVAAVLVLPDETDSPYSTFVSAMERMVEGTAWVFHAHSGAELQRIPGVSGKAVRLSPDGNLLAAQTIVGDLLGPVAVFDVATGERYLELQGTCLWFPDGSYRGGYSDGCEEGEIAGDVTDLTWSPDGRWIAAAMGASRTVQVWNAETGKTLLQSDSLGRFPMSSLAFSPDGSELAVGSKTGMWIFDTATWEQTNVVTHTGRPSWALRYTPDGTRIVSAQAHAASVRVYNAETLAEVTHRIGGEQSRDMGLSPDGSMAAIVSKEGTLAVLDVETGELLELVDRPGLDLTNVEFLDDVHLLISPSLGPLEIITLDVDELVAIARERITRAPSLAECEAFDIDPCPTLSELKAGQVQSD